MKRAFLALGAFLLAGAISALVVMIVIGSPPGRPPWPVYFGYTFLLCLLGPLLFAWAYGPGPMGVAWLAVAFLAPGLSLAALYLGFIKARSRAWLLVAAAIWGAFGGFSAWVAIMGSV